MHHKILSLLPMLVWAKVRMRAVIQVKSRGQAGNSTPDWLCLKYHVNERDAGSRQVHMVVTFETANHHRRRGVPANQIIGRAVFLTLARTAD